ncbi:hypothetical protein GBA52_026648 [Prunus armeniaca]|nr:hypothetical protein GBA52_026648 [Prunus armeniaca]
MSSEELILRHNAYKSLRSFVEFAALILGQIVNNHYEMPDMPNKMTDGISMAIKHKVKSALSHNIL